MAVDEHRAVKFIQLSHDEFYVKGKDGGYEWVDSQLVSDADLMCHKDARTVREFMIEELDLETHKITQYAVTPVSTTRIKKKEFTRDTDWIQCMIK